VTLTKGLAEAQSHLVELEGLGISMEQVTQELEEEGVQAFSDAFTALLKTIEERRARAIGQLGPLQADVSARVGKLEAEMAPQRLHSGDPSLWTSDPAGMAEVSRRMGWLRLPETSRTLCAGLPSLLTELLSEGFTHALLLGMGGSSLAPEVFSLMGTGGNERSGLQLTVLDSTDPDQVYAAEQTNPVEKTLYIVSSKSGTTSEINAYLDYFWTQAQKQLGKATPSHFIAITDPGTPLEALGRKRGFRSIFLADAQVGGRYSALTAFGLVPGALIGWDCDRLLDSAAAMAAQCAANVPAGRNPGLVLGALLGEAANQGRDKLTLIMDPAWGPFGAWLEQLIAESSGKQGKGIIPIVGEPLAGPEAYGQDRLFVYMRQDGACDAKIDALHNAGFPTVTLNVKSLDSLGAEIYRWEVATAIACSILGVNAFDQPDVQDNKVRTAQKVENFRQTGSLMEPEAAWEDERTHVFGGTKNEWSGVRNLKGLIDIFLSQARQGDYVAVNAYLARNELNEQRLEKLRVGIREETKLATTVGFGPRFLHSTGQLHKGGPDECMVIQITGRPDRDLDIPGEGLSFATLERAQALGDLETLQSRGRRVIRVDLKKGWDF
jgi:transaldolase/glucose-6-phosphate isomerase